MLHLTVDLRHFFTLLALKQHHQVKDSYRNLIQRLTLNNTYFNKNLKA
jgi:hypothetical protein